MTPHGVPEVRAAPETNALTVGLPIAVYAARESPWWEIGFEHPPDPVSLPDPYPVGVEMEDLYTAAAGAKLATESHLPNDSDRTRRAIYLSATSRGDRQMLHLDLTLGTPTPGDEFGMESSDVGEPWDVATAW